MGCRDDWPYIGQRNPVLDDAPTVKSLTDRGYLAAAGGKYTHKPCGGIVFIPDGHDKVCRQKDEVC